MGLALQMLPPMVYKLIITILILKVMYLHCSYILRSCLLIVKSLAVLLLCAFKGSTYTCTYVTGSGKTRPVAVLVDIRLHVSLDRKAPLTGNFGALAVYGDRMHEHSNAFRP